MRATLVAAYSFLSHALAMTAETQLSMQDRVEGALWGFFIGDALAMPVHWYYGGPDQIRRDFGGNLISYYESAVHPFPESIMSLSNTGGGGRGSDAGDIIGGMICHDKKEYWKHGAGYHYHITLKPGENTLEASIVRVLMRAMIRNRGTFSADDFRRDYIKFMTTPGTHNDAFAGTCHRMFFKNMRAGIDLKDCPDNDGHNVDTIDGLVLPVVIALASIASGQPSSKASAEAFEALRVTRKSDTLKTYIQVISEIFVLLLAGKPLAEATDQIVRMAYASDIADVVRKRGDRDPMVACYIDGSFPALMHFSYKYANGTAVDALLASTNAGGENAHRGMVLGSFWGASLGPDALPLRYKEGLVDYTELKAEIEDFAKAVTHMDLSKDGEL